MFVTHLRYIISNKLSTSIKQGNFCNILANLSCCFIEEKWDQRLLVARADVASTTASRLKEFDAGITAETECRGGAVLSAAMDYDAASFSHFQAKQQAKVNRAARKQIVNDKRSKRQTAAAVATKVYKPNKR